MSFSQSSGRKSNLGSLKSKGCVRDDVPPNLNGHRFGSKFEMRTMQERMGNRKRFKAKDTHGWLLRHDSIIVKIDDGQWIKAEKGGETAPGKNDGGIHVFVKYSFRAPEDCEDEGDKGPGRYSVRFTTGVINLGNCLTVGELQERLTSYSEPNYNVFSSNCWKYAHFTARDVLNWIRTKMDLEVGIKQILDQKLEELEKVECPMPSKVLRAVFDPLHGSIDVLRQFSNKVAHTGEELQATRSKFRRSAVAVTEFIIMTRLRILSLGRRTSESSSRSTGFN